jgi:hypothetical protein
MRGQHTPEDFSMLAVAVRYNPKIELLDQRHPLCVKRRQFTQCFFCGAAIRAHSDMRDPASYANDFRAESKGNTQAGRSARTQFVLPSCQSRLWSPPARRTHSVSACTHAAQRHEPQFQFALEIVLRIAERLIARGDEIARREAPAKLYIMDRESSSNAGAALPFEL